MSGSILTNEMAGWPCDTILADGIQIGIVRGFL